MKVYNGVTIESKTVNTKNMYVDYSYQRTLDTVRARRIAAHYNPCLVNPVKLSLRDGKYWIFDGQHTTAAEKLVKGGDCDMECRVYYGLRREDEAELFAQQNGDFARGVTTNAKMKALFTSGDVDVVEFKEAVERVGFIMDFSPSKSNNRIVCCSKAFKVFRRVAGHDFFAIMDIIKQAWGGERESLRAEIIGGMAIFYMANKGKINKTMLITRLSKESPNLIIRKGKEFESVKGDYRFAKVILEIYNKKTKSGRLNENDTLSYTL